jgi:hypothetical protein
MLLWQRALFIMLNGSGREKLHVSLVAMGWFAMGAYVASSLEHHLNFFAGSDGMVAVAGGIVAWLAAAVVKAV